MAKRRFQLPGIQDLSKEQEDARALPLEGQHLIIGGPGTGKSILALLRARRLAQENTNYIFLVYNHLLNESSKQLLSDGLISKQWQSWFLGTYKTALGEKTPRLPPKPGTEWSDIDWHNVLEKISSTTLLLSDQQTLIIDEEQDMPLSDQQTLIIDEGQDMPPEFYQSLIRMGYQNFFVVADQNQQIIADLNSTRQELEDALAIEPEDVIELTSNYRNKYPIARLAREFYTGDPASPPPELPEVPTRSVLTPLCYEYNADEANKLFANILRTADRDPSKLIGILTHNNKDRRKYCNGLRACNVQLDNDKPTVTTYANNDSNPVSFNQGGILVINAKACKGLEFDTVFIADINHYPCNDQHRDNIKRLFYVMVARAIDRVILLKQRDEHCPVDSILPTDPSILERR